MESIAKHFPMIFQPYPGVYLKDASDEQWLRLRDHIIFKVPYLTLPYLTSAMVMVVVMIQLTVLRN